MKSLSEIETTSKRATRASGYSWGISEEVGKCIRLLEMFSFKGIKNLNEYFKEKKDKNFENLNLIDENNECLEFSYCPIILGVSFLDQIKNLEKIKSLFGTLGNQELSVKLLEDIASASGVKIFIGSENRLFEGTDCSLIIAPIQTHEQKVFGALGVIGPKRMNYSKIISMVDYTSQIVSKLLNDEEI